MLRAADFEVIETGSGREATEIAEHAEIDLLVTDLRLPDINGRDLAAKVHPRHVLYISGALADDVSPVLVKPFKVQELLGAVRELVEIPSS